MPVYNCESYIENSIRSILTQSFKDIEVICVEDGSSDNTLAILNELASEDSRLNVHHQENQGASIARNNALKLATGDYVYFFDADDFLVEDGLEKMYNNAVRNGSDIVLFRFDYFKNDEFFRIDRNFDLDEFFTDVDFDNFTFDWLAIKDYILRVNTFAPWFKLYKKEFLDKYDYFEFPPNLKHNDVPFHVKTMLKSSKISFIPEFLYHYTNDNPNSITNNPKKNGLDIFHIVDIVEDFLKQENFFEFFEEDFYYFKVKMLTRHMDVNTQEYFDMAKETLSQIDYEDNELIKGIVRFRADTLLESTGLDEYNFKHEIYKLERDNKKLLKQKENLQKKNKILNKKIKKLENQNKKLKSDLHESKKEIKEIKNSHSWKITEPLRKPKQIIHERNR